MITVDVANPDTDLGDLRRLVKASTTEDEREASHELFSYIFGMSDDIDENYLETLLGSDVTPDQGVEAVDDIEELREEVEKQRLSNPTGLQKELAEIFVSITQYVFEGNNQKEAERAQKEAISNDFDVDLKISTDRL